MADQSRWVTWAVVGTAATVTVAGVGYLVYSNFLSPEEDEEPSSSGVNDAATSAKLSVAKAIQMQSLTPAGAPSGAASTSSRPALPARADKAAAPAKPSAPKTAAPAGNNRGMCAHCSKPTAGLPLRCSGCKQVYYCSQDCQKKAWPEHKAQCKASKQQSGTPTTPTQASTAPTTAAPAPQPDTATASQDPKSLQEALAQYLEETAASKSDELEANFERAVMLFVRSEFPACIEKLLDVQALAKERGSVDMQGEVFKWLGHAHNRLLDTQRAEQYFQEGIEWGKQHNLAKLQIDCLGGLGSMYKSGPESNKAVQLLEQALVLSEASGDADSKASTLCSLGEALMKVDPARGLSCLRESTAQRELMVEQLHDAGERNGLATAVMEHSNSLVSLANALMIAKEWQEAEACFLRALEVFELVEDVDKIVKVLVSLANLKELQGGTAASRQQAQQYRLQLLKFMESHGVRRLDTECAVCKQPISVQGVTQSADDSLIMLSCLHCLHHACWNGWVAEEEAGASTENSACPTCKQRTHVSKVDV